MPLSSSSSSSPRPRAGLLAGLLLLLLLMVTRPSSSSQSYVAGNNCLYISRQKDGQVLIYSDYSFDEHGDHFEPIGALSTNPNPTGIASFRDLIYVGSYGRSNKRGHSPATIQIFDARHERQVGDLSSIPELAACFPEALVFHHGFLYVACGAVGQGVLKIEPEKKILKKRFATEIPLVWGLTARENYLYLGSHCHEEDDANEGITGFCEKEKHDKIFRVDLNEEALTPTVFASFPGEHAAGFADLTFAHDGSLVAVSFHRNSLIHFSSTGEFLKELEPEGLEYPIGIAQRDLLLYYPSPGRGEISQFDIEKERQDLYAHPGPLLNSRLSYLSWARCPLRKKDEL